MAHVLARLSAAFFHFHQIRELHGIAFGITEHISDRGFRAVASKIALSRIEFPIASVQGVMFWIAVMPGLTITTEATSGADPIWVSHIVDGIAVGRSAFEKGSPQEDDAVLPNLGKLQSNLNLVDFRKLVVGLRTNLVDWLMLDFA